MQLNRRTFLAALAALLPISRVSSACPLFVEVADPLLTVDSVAAAFHIPLPMVGILERATFNNIKEQHEQLYVDALAPWIKAIEDAATACGMTVEPPKDAPRWTQQQKQQFREQWQASIEQEAALQTLVGRQLIHWRSVKVGQSPRADPQPRMWG